MDINTIAAIIAITLVLSCFYFGGVYFVMDCFYDEFPDKKSRAKVAVFWPFFLTIYCFKKVIEGILSYINLIALACFGVDLKEMYSKFKRLIEPTEVGEDQD